MLRGHRRKVVFAALLSAGAVVGQVLIPLLVGDAVNKINSGERSELVRSGLALLGLPFWRRSHRDCVSASPEGCRWTSPTISATATSAVSRTST